MNVEGHPIEILAMERARSRSGTDERTTDLLVHVPAAAG